MKPFWHFCPFTRCVIDASSREILECRCFDSDEFFAAQDAMAASIDFLRKPAEQ